MQSEDIALIFFDTLERAENALLAWGIVDSFFAEEELVQRAELFLRRCLTRTGLMTPGAILFRHSLMQVCSGGLPDSNGRYRTRMAETVRLFTRLRQIFSNAPADAWRLAPGLVADFRLLIRPRLFPLRSIAAPELLQYLSDAGISLQQVQINVARKFLQVGTGRERKAAAFQVRATARILRMVGEPSAVGTVVSAGTGSGKTMAFYLPTYVAIAPVIQSAVYWTKCFALYPRNELLKDQLREALIAAKRIASPLLAAGKRRLIVAALYGATPRDAKRVRTGRINGSASSSRANKLSSAPTFDAPIAVVRWVGSTKTSIKKKSV